MKKIFLLMAAMISLNLMADGYHNALYDDICYRVEYVGTEYWATVINSDYDFTEITSTYDGDVVLPEKVLDDYEYTVTEIGMYAFNESDITSIELPSKLDRILYHAFNGCDKLTSITCRRFEDLGHNGVIYPLLQSFNAGTLSYEDIPASDVFGGVSSSIPVYVSADVVTAYKNSPWGSYFTNILPITTTAIDNAAVEIEAVKLLRDGQILILRDGKMYNVMGAEVK